jgi:hypothetical protein
MSGRWSLNLHRRINTTLRNNGIKTQSSLTYTREITEEIKDYVITIVRCQQCESSYKSCRDKFGHDRYHYIRYKDIRKIFR